MSYDNEDVNLNTRNLIRDALYFSANFTHASVVNCR